MNKLILQGIALLIISLSTNSLFALNLQKFSSGLASLSADESSRSTLLGIVGSCGNANHLDDDCVVQGLERVATEEDNVQAKNILSNYEQAINEGHFELPECQTNSHMQVNRTIGHCLLLLNYYALETNDNNAAISQYETCLQGGMLGLAYEGNLAAQLVLSEIFQEKGLSDPANLWRNSLKTRKDSDEYALLMKCYR